MRSLILLSLPVLATTAFLLAEPPAATTTPAADPAGTPLMTCEQAAFERLKALAGSWEGPAKHESFDGSPAVDAGTVQFEYRLTAGGNALMETLFAGHPHEMVTMYHLDGPHLALTHYCAAGNQPYMVAKTMSMEKDQPVVLEFECTHLGNAESENVMHMHKGTLTIIDNDHIKGEWTGHQDGKPVGVARFELHRKPAAAPAPAPHASPAKG